MTPVDRERLRQQIIRLLAAHKDTEFRLTNLIDRLVSEMPDATFGETDVLESLSFLEGMLIVRKIESPLYGPPKWKITMEGVHFHERNP